MKIRTLGLLNLFVAFTTFIWVTLTVVRATSSPAGGGLAGQVAAVQDGYPMFVLNYANAGLITLATAALYAAFYVYLRDDEPLWAAVSLVFVPMYATLNIVVYLSQVLIVPHLIELYAHPATKETGEILLQLALHEWPGSAAAYLNGLAYALLGIPSMIMGAGLGHKRPALRAGGWLLSSSGALSWIALAGQAAGNAVISGMTLVSGGIFLVALIWLGVVFITQPDRKMRRNP